MEESGSDERAYALNDNVKDGPDEADLGAHKHASGHRWVDVAAFIGRVNSWLLLPSGQKSVTKLTHPG